MVLDRDPDQAREILAGVERTGRDALDELDRVLGVLGVLGVVAVPAVTASRSTGVSRFDMTRVLVVYGRSEQPACQA